MWVVWLLGSQAISIRRESHPAARESARPSIYWPIEICPRMLPKTMRHCHGNTMQQKALMPILMRFPVLPFLLTVAMPLERR